MTLPSDEYAARLTAAARWAGAGAAGIGLLVLAGWAVGAPILRGALPGWAPMRPNSAIGVVLLGAALAALAREGLGRRAAAAAQAAAAAAALLGAATLAEYGLHADLGVDALFFREAQGAVETASQGRMSAVSALALTLIGSALLTLRRGGVWAERARNAFAGGAGAVVFVQLLSYVFGIEALRRFGGSESTSFPAAAALSLLSGGAFVARHDGGGPAALAASPGAGGQSFRRLFPAAVAVPLALGWLVAAGAKGGALDAASGVALAFTAVTALSGAAVYRLCRALDAKEAEIRRGEEIRRTGAYNRSLLEASLDPLVAIGPDGRITDVNAATERTTGLPRAGLIGTDFAERFTDPEAARMGYRRVFSEGSVRDYPLEIRGPDGRAVPVMYNASVYRDEGGAVAGVFAAARDVTELRRGVEALRESEKRFRTLVESLPQKICLKDRRSKYVMCNANLAADLKIPAEAVAGKSDYDFFPKALADKYTADDARVMGTGVIEDLEEEYRRDGSVEYVHTVKVPMRDERGDVSGELVIFWDVTKAHLADLEIRRLNAELEERVKRRTAQLETINRELESFAYSVSHDLRAPLRAIDGYSLMLVEDHAARLDDEGRRLLGTVRESVQGMGTLIDDLLAFSRMSRQEPLRKPADMRRIVDAAVESLAKAREGRRVRLEIGPLTPCVGDQALLKQVWVNLLGNALKFTRRREEAVIRVGSRVEGGETVYWIEDNGVGFDMRYADKLFKVFQRLHRAAEYEGTGIGLAIVARIVERHGGRVWARGEPDKGARFSFTLEARHEQRQDGGDPAGRGRPEG